MSLDGRTGLKLEDIIQRLDNRSAWRTTIHSADYTLGPRMAKGKARQGKSSELMRTPENREKQMRNVNCAHSTHCKRNTHRLYSLYIHRGP